MRPIGPVGLCKFLYPKIGEQIAVTRALSDLAQQLLSIAASDIEAITHERTLLHL